LAPIQPHSPQWRARPRLGCCHAGSPTPPARAIPLGLQALPCPPSCPSACWPCRTRPPWSQTAPCLACSRRRRGWTPGCSGGRLSPSSRCAAAAEPCAHLATASHMMAGSVPKPPRLALPSVHGRCSRVGCVCASAAAGLAVWAQCTTEWAQTPPPRHCHTMQPPHPHPALPGTGTAAGHAGRQGLPSVLRAWLGLWPPDHVCICARSCLHLCGPRGPGGPPGAAGGAGARAASVRLPAPRCRGHGRAAACSIPSPLLVSCLSGWPDQAHVCAPWHFVQTRAVRPAGLQPAVPAAAHVPTGCLRPGSAHACARRLKGGVEGYVLGQGLAQGSFTRFTYDENR